MKKQTITRYVSPDEVSWADDRLFVYRKKGNVNILGELGPVLRNDVLCPVQ